MALPPPPPRFLEIIQVEDEEQVESKEKKPRKGRPRSTKTLLDAAISHPLPVRVDRFIVGIDLGPVNTFIAIIRYTPADKPLRARKRGLDDAPLQIRRDHCRLVAGVYINPKGGAIMAEYTESGGHIVHPPMQYYSDSSLLDCTNGMEECVSRWDFLDTNPEAAVFFEMQVDQTQGRKKSHKEKWRLRVRGDYAPIEAGDEEEEEEDDDDALYYEVRAPINYAIMGMLAGIIRTRDRFTRPKHLPPRTIEASAKKDGVNRGSAYSQKKRHKAESIMQARRSMSDFGDRKALNFLTALETSPHLKADDFTDAYNLALWRGRNKLRARKRKKLISQPGFVAQ